LQQSEEENSVSHSADERLRLQLREQNISLCEFYVEDVSKDKCHSSKNYGATADIALFHAVHHEQRTANIKRKTVKLI
jgi:hypothetical protein